jgi:hypothetical protein
MNSVDLLKGIYHSYVKPEPCKLSEHLGTCLTLLNQHSLIPQVLRLCDLSASPLQKSAQDIIKKWCDRIVELMNIPTGTGEDRNRAASVALFAHTISHATYELMHANKDQWISTLSLIVNKKTENEVVSGVALVAFANLIVKASTWDQTRRDVLKDAVYGSFMNSLVRSLEERPIGASQDVMKALYIVLKANLKSRIPLERLLQVLLTILDKAQTMPGKLGLQIYQDAARCIPLLMDSGSTWGALVEHIVVTTHYILEKLYVGFDDELSLIRNLLPKTLEDQGVNKGLFFVAWKMKESSNEDLSVSLHRVTILTHLLQLLMSAPLNYSVDVPVFELLIIVRHLMLLDGTRASSSPSHGLSGADLLHAAPLLHQCAHIVLETMIRQFRSRLFPFVKQIADLVNYELATSRNFASAPSLATPDVQASLHRLITALLEVFKTSVVGITSDAVQLALEDLQLDNASTGAFAALKSETEPVSAATASQPKQNPNKKKAANKALSDPSAHVNAEALTAATGATTATSSKPISLRLAAFDCLQSALTHMGAFISDDVRASIDKSILGLCITMTRHQNAPLWRKSQFEPAFAHPAIRLGLYRTLLASAISTGRLQTPVLPYAAQYLTFGLNDPDGRVASACTQAMDVLNVVLHPRVPLLPPSITAEQRTSQLSTQGILAHQSEKQLLQLHEEKTLMLLQRTQGRRGREGEGEGMEDDRPTKKQLPVDFEPSSAIHRDSSASKSSNTSSSSALGPKAELNGKGSAAVSATERTVLFKSTPAKEQKPNPSDLEENPTATNMMAVDVDIVDDEPDSEDEA